MKIFEQFIDVDHICILHMQDSSINGMTPIEWELQFAQRQIQTA